MRKLKIGLVRKQIKDDGYLSDRMRKMMEESIAWMDACLNSAYREQRAFYLRMSNMYHSRYSWYANKRKQAFGV
jgi:hypothetical protein